MKLGEALRLRSDNYKKIEELHVRAAASAQMQEGPESPDIPLQLLEEIEQIAAMTLALVQRINRTNVATRLPSGQTLVDALAERDSYLKLRKPFETGRKRRGRCNSVTHVPSRDRSYCRPARPRRCRSGS